MDEDHRNRPEAHKLQRMQTMAETVTTHVDCAIDYSLDLLKSLPADYSGDPSDDVQLALLKIADIIVTLEEMRDALGPHSLNAMRLVANLRKD